MAGDTLSTVATALAGDLGSTIASVSGNTIQLIGKPSPGYTVAVAIRGVSPQALAIISGTPVVAESGLINWNTVVFDLTSPARTDEKWTLTLAGTAMAPYTVLSTDAIRDVATGIKSKITGAYTSSVSASPFPRSTDPTGG